MKKSELLKKIELLENKTWKNEQRITTLERRQGMVVGEVNELTEEIKPISKDLYVDNYFKKYPNHDKRNRIMKMDAVSFEMSSDKFYPMCVVTCYATKDDYEKHLGFINEQKKYIKKHNSTI